MLLSDNVCSLASHLGNCDERETVLIWDGRVRMLCGFATKIISDLESDLSR
jgi:hypothetical protein